MLGYLEVAFRNALNGSIAAKVRRADWYDGVSPLLRPREVDEVTRAKRELQRKSKVETPDGIVAELKFGFWNSLLSREYERVLWPALMPSVFRGMPRHERYRARAKTRLESIRKLRNRVSHHEPIWHWADLRQQHDDLCDTIRWFEPSLIHLIDATHRFEDVYDRGPGAYVLAVVP